MTNDMTNEEALKLIQHKLDLAVDDPLIMTDKEFEVFSLCAKALEQLTTIKNIINDHDKDSMPEDFWYLDRIREVIK